MNFSFHELAQTELMSTIDYYEECQAGLGLCFSEEIYATVERICQFPLAWESVDSKTRRCLLSRFPYGILYRIAENEIRVMAIMNLHRKSCYWKDRK